MTDISLATQSPVPRDRTGFYSSGPSPTPSTVHLVGPGAVGRALLRKLPDTGLRLIGVTDCTATVFDRAGLDPVAVASWKESGRSLGEWPAGEPVSTPVAVSLVGANVVVDATATDAATTGQALERGRAALRAGARLALAAKNALGASRGEWLLQAQRGRLGCNAVLGGTGRRFVAELAELRARCDEVALCANVSTTAIALAIEAGASVQDGIASAQREGYLESDPTLDLDGTDAAVKLGIVAAALWGEHGSRWPSLADIVRQDVATLDPDLLRARAARGVTTRLVARARRGDPVLRVAFEELPRSAPLAAPPDRVVYTYRIGDCLRVHTGHGVGPAGTAQALLEDVVALAAAPAPELAR